MFNLKEKLYLLQLEDNSFFIAKKNDKNWLIYNPLNKNWEILINKIKDKTFILFILFLFFTPLLYPSDIVTVLYVIDGDTIEVSFQDGKIERIRMIGIDCPESLKKNNPEEYEGISNVDYLYNWAVQIKKHTQNVLLNKKITLQYDSVAGRNSNQVNKFFRILPEACGPKKK